MGVLIRDGHTRKGRIERVEGLHERLDFEFRPMLAADVEAFEGSLEAAKPRKVVELIAAMIARQMTSWSEDEAISAATVLRLPHPVLLRLRGIVQGTRPSDPIDSPKAEELDEDVDAYASSLLAEVEGARGN